MNRCCMFVMLVVAVICRCTTNGPDISGTSEQGNARIMAMVYTPEGDPAIAATVRLRRTDYLNDVSAHEPKEDRYRDVSTGTDGSFIIDSVSSGTYFIEINDNNTHAVLLQCRVTDLDTLTLASDTLRPYAIVKGKVSPDSSGRRRFVIVAGLERKVEVPDNGTYTITDIPAGTFLLKLIEEDAGITPVDINNIDALSGKTTLVPYNGWLFSKTISLNTTASGAGLATDIYNFPVLVRLHQSNFDFEEAMPDGEDIRFVKIGADSLPLPSEIERWDPVAGFAEIWVNVDTVHADTISEACIMQWGNPAVPQGTGTYHVFDTAYGFSGVWHLSDADNAVTRDATPNRYTGNAYNVKVIDGIIGSAGAFSSTDKSYITISQTAQGSLDFPVDGNYSVSVWVNSDSITYNRVIIGKGDVQYYLRIHNFNWHFAEYHNTPTPGWEITASPYSYGTWVHLCGVRKGTSQYLYVDGVCVDSSITRMGGDTLRDESFDVEIGRRLLPDGIDGLYFSGAIDEVRICRTARNDEWIRLCYMNQRYDDKLVIMQF